MQYALCAAAEALADARWHPSTEAQRQATGVTIGNGMSSTAEVAEAGQLIVSVRTQLSACSGRYSGCHWLKLTCESQAEPLPALSLSCPVGYPYWPQPNSCPVGWRGGRLKAS